ncbi:hypothetical protein, partial [Accumulibacter sp.]|uniref:hypothetical protein n=1 Tax=Accumulibacter sp. TaxID=2053492 RepID=UPI001AC4E7E2
MAAKPSPRSLESLSPISGDDCRCGAQQGSVWRRRPGVRPGVVAGLPLPAPQVNQSEGVAQLPA